MNRDSKSELLPILFQAAGLKWHTFLVSFWLFLWAANKKIK